MKINDFETAQERFRRKRSEMIQKEYLLYATDILCGKVSPNRVINYLAGRFSMSGYGVKTVLMRKGIYKSAKEPVVTKKFSTPSTCISLPSHESAQLATI